jgi:hypothetical protein
MSFSCLLLTEKDEFAKVTLNLEAISKAQLTSNPCVDSLLKMLT